MKWLKGISILGLVLVSIVYPYSYYMDLYNFVLESLSFINEPAVGLILYLFTFAILLLPVQLTMGIINIFSKEVITVKKVLQI